jgi:hypothetical protein
MMHNDKNIKIKKLYNIAIKLHTLVEQLKKQLALLDTEHNAQVINEKIKGYRLPVAPQVIDKIVKNNNTTPQQKIAIAKEFQRRKLQQQQLRNAVKASAENMSVDEYEMSVVNTISGGNKPYHIVPDTSYRKPK